MANAVADRLRNQAAESGGMSRVYNRRGRVLSGYGGTLGGYTMSLQKNNADKEDQIMQNKYANGEVGVDEMVTYLTNTANRSWLSVEDKKLLMQTIGQMKEKKADADYADKYSSGTITARQYLNYKQQRLAGIKQGSPLYDSLSTDVEQLKQAAGKEDLNTYFKKEAARISNLGDATSQYMGYENLYRDMATRANGFGLADEANDYLTKAGEYKIESNKEIQNLKVANTKAEKTNLINKINLAINSYVNNEISPQEFSGVLDQFQSTAVNSGHTDLLKDLNTWGNDVREDVQYGKAWDRGGNRIKGPGVGTGGGSTYDIYGNMIDDGGGSGSGSGSGSGGGTGGSYSGGGSSAGGGSISNSSGNQLMGPPEAKTQKTTDEKNQTPEEEDKMFKDNYDFFMNQAQNGEITGEKFMENLSGLLSIRSDDLTKRLGILGNLKPNSKVYYNGTKQKVSNIIDELNKEIKDDWTHALGIDAKDVAKVGISDLLNNLQKNPGNLAVVMQDTLTNGLSGAGSQPLPFVIKKLPGMEGDWIADSNGINQKINFIKSNEIIDGVTFGALKPEEQRNYKWDAVGMGYKKVNDRYIDVQDKASGQFLRYWLKGDNTVKSVQLNGNEDINEDYKQSGATGLVPLSVLGKQINDLKKQTEERTLNDQKTLVEKTAAEKAAMPKQLGLTQPNNQKPVLNMGNLPKANVEGNIKIDAGTPLNSSQPVGPTIVKPTFASKQVDLPQLTPSQNQNFGTSFAASQASQPKILTSTSTPAQAKANTQAASKLQLASEQLKPIATSTKLNFTPQQTAEMAPPVVEQKKPSLWDKITSLFRR